jgi:hypothetical protein
MAAEEVSVINVLVLIKRTMLCPRHGGKLSEDRLHSTGTPKPLVAASAEAKLLFEVVELILQRLLARLHLIAPRFADCICLDVRTVGS